jgi:hypothetical protein
LGEGSRGTEVERGQKLGLAGQLAYFTGKIDGHRFLCQANFLKKFVTKNVKGKIFSSKEKYNKIE